MLSSISKQLTRPISHKALLSSSVRASSSSSSSLFFWSSSSSPPRRTVASTRTFVTSSRALLADAATSSSSSTAGQSGSLSLRLVTPNETIVNNEVVYMVTVPAVTGVMGILADHAPTIAQLQPGVVTVYRNDLNDITHRLFVSGGFAVVNNESAASITAVEAIKLDDIDINAARNNLSEAQSLLARVTGDKEKAQAQISIDVYEGLIAALEAK